MTLECPRESRGFVESAHRRRGSRKWPECPPERMLGRRVRKKNSLRGSHPQTRSRAATELPRKELKAMNVGYPEAIAGG